MEDAKGSFYPARLSKLNPQEFVRKILKLDSLYRFYFLSGQKKQCGGVCSEMLRIQVGSF